MTEEPMASSAEVSQRPKIKNPEFINHLKAKRLLPEEFIDDLLREFHDNALDILMALIQTGYGSKQELCQIWCNTIGIAHVDLEKTLFQTDVVRRLPEAFAREYYAIPVYQMGDTITVATATPQNKKVLKEIEVRIGGRVNLVFALPEDIEWAIEQEYRTHTALQDFLKKISASQALTSEERITHTGLKQIAGEEAVNQLHVAIILVGITENTSEILIEPSAEDAKVYFIDHQNIKEKFLLDFLVYKALAVNLKKLAKLDEAPAETARYSRILFPTPGKKYDIRFLSLPTETEEKIFLKLMDRRSLSRLPQFETLYMSKRLQEFIAHQLDTAKGIFLLAGPNPAEQTAIAYAMLSKSASGKGMYLTIEDEIKYLLRGVEQYQVNPQAGLTRRALLESCLKQHPKMIYIQDIENAELTDLLAGMGPSELFIIAGIKSEDTFQALSHAIRLGIGGMVTAIVAQQSAARLCEHCKEKYLLPEETAQQIFITHGKKQIPVWRETGCAYCGHTGFIGSIGIYEYLPVTSAVRSLAEADAPRSDMHQKAREYNYESMAYDGIKKVLRGLTPLKEIERIQGRCIQ
ncbi:MAG: Flp pilus assembly complex ATPase component TadA [Desulfobacterales bacterium]|nr:Flp pilus assembly complex ATPase component TadA [Desulfobacterales bacterium]